MTVIQDDLVAYALGILEPERMSQIEQHLQNHPEDARAVEEYLAGLAQMVLELEPEPLSPPMVRETEYRLLKQIHQNDTSKNDASKNDTSKNDASKNDALQNVSAVQEQPQDLARGLTPHNSQRISWLWPSGLAAAAVVAVLYLGGWQQIQNWQQRQLEHSYIAQPGSISKPLLGAKGDSRGLLVRLANNQVFVSLELAPTSNKVYQLWEIRDKKIFSLGIFAGKTFVGSREIQAGSVVGVTLEPPGGSDQPTQAPLALVQL
jgi:anti-sigma-K factor RskA